MLRLLTRRAAVQLPLLAAVVAVVTIGATLLGVCALLLTVSQDRGLNQGMSRAPAPDVRVTAYVTGVPGKHAQAVADDTRTVVTQALGPFAAPAAIRASSITRPLDQTRDENRPGRRRVAYLSALDGLADRARLTTGRWPAAGAPPSGPLEAAVLESTARRLDLAPGSRVDLGPEVGFGAEAPPVSVLVVGIFQPLADAGWDRDPLAGTGYNPAFRDGAPEPVRAYGPFVVDLAALFASGATLDRLQVTVEPDLSAPTAATLDQVATSLAGANARVRRVLGDRVKLERIASDLPYTLGLARAQQAVTRSTVLTVVLLGTALTAAALGLAGRLVAGLRANETALLSALGATRSQLVAVAAVEAAGLAAIAAALAVPLSGLTHAGLTHLPALADAGLAARPGVTGAQVTAVAAGALLLATVLVIPALRPDPEATAPRGRSALLARSGADLLLLGLALVGWWQLRAQPATESGVDSVRVLAPALFLLAGAATAPRLLAVPLRAAERAARRSRGLVLPLAAFEAARRPRAVAAGLLLALAAATATFGLAFGATWERSQRDQADARVGTDLALALTAPVQAGQGRSVAGATGGVVSPATDRGVVIGRWVGDAGEAPRIVAVDTTKAATLLRARLPGATTWSEVGSRLAPPTAVRGVALPTANEPALTLSGTATPGPQLQVVPRLVLQDRDGVRTTCDAAPVSLDGREHPLPPCRSQAEGARIVALALQINLDLTSSSGSDQVASESQMTVSLTRPGPPDPAVGADWAATSVGNDPERLDRPSAQVASTPLATVVRTTAVVNLARLLPTDPVEVVTTAFAAPPAVPVAVSGRLQTALGLSVGDPLGLTVGGTRVPAVVARLVPMVPSAPGEAALLADVDLLSRALITGGDLDPAIDAWWVGRPADPGAAAGLGLGRVVTRAEVSELLSRGPLRVGLPAALLVLIPATILLVLAGTIMHVTSDVEARALEVARLRGLGLSRRSILGGLLAQHGAVLVLLISAGTAVGALASWAVGPLLIRSDVGAAPVPAALASWPGPGVIALLAGLLVGGTAIVALAIAVQLRRADAAHLRVGA